MERCTLLWVDLGIGRRRARVPRELEQHFEIVAGLSPMLDDLDALVPKPDMICLDYDFPDMQGLRFLVETKKRHPSIPLLMLTLQHSEELAVWAFRSRVFDYLVKPLSRLEVERCVARFRDVMVSRRVQSRRDPRSDAGPLPAATRYHAVTTRRESLQIALAYVAKSLSVEINVQEAANLCDMSLPRFSREFKAEYGMTFLDYVCQQRIEEAKRLLENPAIAVTDVAGAVGFTDPSYFGRVFRRAVGCSPSEFRDAITTDLLSVTASLRIPVLQIEAS
jgi:YesN/AraC family two-component response regulator